MSERKTEADSGSRSALAERPELLARVHAFGAANAHLVRDLVSLRAAQFDAGLAWVYFPEGRGGLGLPRGVQAEVDVVLADYGIPAPTIAGNPIGVGMAAPTLLAFASGEHCDRYLKRIFTGEDIWCQLFSEPSNGSDVAGVATRATRTAGGWIVNGQKVWTSFAHLASFGLLLVRTDPNLPKHRGLSYFVLDMSSPGVEVRPLFQISGDSQFNEVFLTDVFVPDDAMLGGVGDGWAVATATLMNERVALGGAGAQRMAEPLLSALDAAENSCSPVEFAVYQDQVARLWIESEAFVSTMERVARAAAAGEPGPEGSIGKLWGTEIQQRIAALELELTSRWCVGMPEGYPLTRSSPADYGGSPAKRYLRSRGFTIEGGTSEINRNIVGERVLGLPPDLRVDKNVPWNEIPR
ncbi:acyl-CoA dehydrogenase family protein [Nocardia miyunensis]|uniref:acyl-CoA dehydrogenase family protein n=1 Tax=Nocardia miyunensis TaxID=282684 RepID=UPI00082B12BC|nr:acyl-CoA dehydrogenase family protein [Nocardia miyunensis]